MTTPKATLLITNAQVWTANPAQPLARAVAARDNRILYVGDAAGAEDFRDPATRVIDAGGGALLPGLIDSHFHLMLGALNLDGMALDDVTDYAGLAAAARAYAAAQPNAPWLVGSGLRYNAGPGPSALTRQHLDALVEDRPVYINAYDGHTSWANTRALELAGLMRGGDCGANSEIVLDEHGLATGELREPGAFRAVVELIPRPTAARKRELLREALRQLAAVGVTSIHNMNGGAEELGFYQELLGQGELTCRVYYPYSISPETPLEALAREALPPREELRGDVLRAGSVKFFIDGVIEGYTGWLVEPYADRPETCGDSNYPFEDYQRLVVEADRLGFQICTHAVGDRGVRAALDAYQAARRNSGRTDARHRVEHIELVHPQDAPRFAELGVIAAMQPLHAPGRVDDGDIWPARVGEARWPRSFAWQTLREAGATLVFGSDWPVAPFHPLRGVAHAMLRQPWLPGAPHHRQSLAAALDSYTRAAAFAEFQEHQKGQLRPGYLADLALFEQDVLNLPAEELAGQNPALTVMDGRVVFEK